MRKFIAFFSLLFVSLFILSCNDNDRDNYEYTDNDTYSVVYDLKNVNFSYTAADGWHYYRQFNGAMYNSDVMLMFRQIGTTNDGSPIWQQIPRTLYLTVDGNSEELDYDFDFSKYDFTIYAGGTYDLAQTPQYLNNQTFRVVLVPADFGKLNIDYSKMSYEEIIKHYNIDDSKPVSL